MCVTGPVLLWRARWLGSLVTWFVGLARRARARLGRGRPRSPLHASDARRQGDPLAALRETEPQPKKLALAAVVSSELPLFGKPQTVTVPARVTPPDIEQAVAVLHQLGGLLLLDLSSAQTEPLEHCDVLASTWPSSTAGPTPRTRMAIKLKFVHWALMRGRTTPQLALLASKGVEALLCYEEQRWDEWFISGAIVHDVKCVLETLSALLERQQPHTPDELSPEEWRIVLDTAASLLDGSPPAELCELTRIALGCGATGRAVELANETLRVAERGSVHQCRALRLLGMAMLRQGHAVGARVLQDALTMAIATGAYLDAAEAFNALGLHELRLGKRADAESRLRDAMELCPLDAELCAPLRERLQSPPN